MSTVARNLLTPIVAGLLVGLLAQQASATEEIVVYGSAASVLKVDTAVFRAEIDSYIHALTSEIRTTLDRNSKRMPAPKLELASSTAPARG